MAAESLGCTQSNASHAIGALEREYGFALLIRNRHGASLTPEGERLLPAMRAVCDAQRALSREVQQLRQLQSGTVRVGAFTSVAVHWLPQIIKGFGQVYPNISFALVSGDYHDLDRALLEGSVDAAFIRLPTALGCTALPLYEDRLMAIVPPEHPMAGEPCFALSKIKGESFISLLESSAHDSIRLLREAGIEPDIRFTTKDDYALIAMVESGLGISIVPELLLRGRSDRLVALPLDPPGTRTIALAIADASRRSPAVTRFAEYVTQWAKARKG